MKRIRILHRTWRRKFMTKKWINHCAYFIKVNGYKYKLMEVLHE